MKAPPLSRCTRAVATAWAHWRPVLTDAPGHDAAVIDAVVAVAVDESASPRELADARARLRALPTMGPPPPYVGHFYGGVLDLLEGRLEEDERRRTRALRSSLRFARVAYDGNHLEEGAAPVPRPGGAGCGGAGGGDAGGGGGAL